MLFEGGVVLFFLLEGDFCLVDVCFLIIVGWDLFCLFVELVFGDVMFCMDWRIVFEVFGILLIEVFGISIVEVLWWILVEFFLVFI